MTKETYPCCLVVEGKAYALTSVNENRLARRLQQLYKPTQVVEVWVDGKKSNELELQDIFNYGRLD